MSLVPMSIQPALCVLSLIICCELLLIICCVLLLIICCVVINNFLLSLMWLNPPGVTTLKNLLSERARFS